MKIAKKIASIMMTIAFVLSMLIVPAQKAEASEKTWTSVWSTSMVDCTVKDVINYKKGVIISSAVNLKNNTARMALKVNGSGEKLRLVLSNEFGEAAQPIQSISVGRTDTSGKNKNKIKSDRKQVTYNGKKNFSIPAGQRIVTDDIALSVTAGEYISVSIYYGNREPDTIGLYGADSWSHLVIGDYTGTNSFGLGGEQLYSDDSKATGHFDLIPSLCEVDVYGDQLDGCVVIFGDSTVTNEIPNYLAENLRANGINNISVTMAAIKGNRLIRDGVEDSDSQGPFLGIAGIKRFEKDALEQANVKAVIVKIGDNDIVHPYCSDMHSPVADYYEMQDAFRYLGKACRDNGVSYYVSEIQPWKGYTREGTVNWSLEIDQLRFDLNEWIMNELYADQHIDLGFITDGYGLYADETTDGAHPNDKGQRKTANQLVMYLS